MYSMQIYDLLVKMDGGYEPTAAERNTLANRQRLDLINTRITALPESIGNLTALQMLDLGGTGITALPESIGKLTALQELNLWDTGITALPESIGKLTALQRLDLSGTDITALPESIGKLTNLQWIVLANTRITALPEGIRRLINLQVLHLGNTTIDTLPEYIGELPNLRILALWGMKLTGLPKSLLTGAIPFTDEDRFDPDIGTGIYIRHTTIEGKPHSLLLQSQEMRIRTFGSGVKQDINEAKVIFLGYGEVGKSYTIMRMLNNGLPESPDNPYKTSTTHGVKIEDYTPEGKKLRVHLWDFGGQEIMHSMHRCFLTENTGYVVMVDTRKAGQTAQARYWLQNVKSFAPHAPVILYLNLWDSRTAIDDLDVSKIIGQFGNDLDITVVKCSSKYADQAEFQTMMGKIAEMAEKVVRRMGQIPAKYVAIKNELNELSAKNPCLPVEKFAEICKKHKVKERKDLLNWFNQLGICFTYQRDNAAKVLSGFKLLQPKWLTNAIYAMIMEGRKVAPQGQITRQGIYDFLGSPEPERENGEPQTRIDPNTTYTPEECDYVIEVAKGFNLVYDAEKYLFFPSMLKNETPEEIAENEKKPDVRYELIYDYLPDTVIHQLMVECMKRQINLDAYWLRGMRVKAFGGLSAVVQMVEDDKTMTIDVYADGSSKPYELFKTLREIIRVINGRLNMDCIDNILSDTGERFTIDRLVAERRRGNEVIIGDDGREYRLVDLIGDSIDIKKELPDREREIPIRVTVTNEPAPEPNKDENKSKIIKWVSKYLPFIKNVKDLIFTVFGIVIAITLLWGFTTGKISLGDIIDYFNKSK